MTVSITPTVKWINPCFTHDDQHEHVSVYVVEENDQHILIDSGSFYHREEIREQLDDVVGVDGLDAIVLSHSDYPHSGNVSAFRSEWDSVELIASSGSPEIQGLSDARQCVIGESMDILDRSFSFIDPPLADRSHTTWIYDHHDRVLFTADGFGQYHSPGSCTSTSIDFDGEFNTENILRYHRDNLVWLRYVDPEKLRTAIESIFESYHIECIAPVHGNPIMEEHIESYTDTLIEAAATIESEYDVASKN